MTNRRQFMQSGLAFSVLPLTELSAMKMAVAAPEGAYLTLESFVADKRYMESIATASKISSEGVPVVEITGDMTELWIGQYSKQWKQAPMTLAGVTGSDALFVLETLAPDYGMRVIHKRALDTPGSQSVEGNPQVFSWIIAPKKLANAVI